jgi:lysophospholipase L1-like esterase
MSQFSRPILPATIFSAILPVLAFRDLEAQAQEPLAGVRRVVFLGDSITYSGEYIEYVETALRLKYPKLECEFLDLGLPSETLSGLSEPGHAGGQFPRPDLHERLDRLLAKAKPDLIVACYGMNDGIYYPFGGGRFEKYQEGIRFLRERAKSINAKVLHVTPPVFDPVPIKSRTLPAGLAEYRQPYEGYDDVLDRYSQWLLSQREQGWDIIDAHGPLKRFLAEKRQAEPQYRLADDGVHINSTGHWLIAQQLMRHWGVPPVEIPGTSDAANAIGAKPRGREILGLVQQKQRLLKDAWLTEIGHKRPGMNRGVSLDDAKLRASEIDAKIQMRLDDEQ